MPPTTSSRASSGWLRSFGGVVVVVLLVVAAHYHGSLQVESLHTDCASNVARLRREIQAAKQQQQHLPAPALATPALRAEHAGPPAATPAVAPTDPDKVEAERRCAAAAAAHTIPKVVHLVWKSTELPAEAKKLDEEWRQREPEYVRVLTTDAGCRELANAFPGMQPHYDNLPLNVMRADVCRILVVHAHGGVYMDLDVGWVKPLHEWLDLSGPIQLGYEQATLTTNWFFAAQKGDQCLKHALEYIISKIIKIERNVHGNWVLHATGPVAFMHAMRQCGAKVKWSGEQMTRDLITHKFGSLTWVGTGYESWQMQRKAMQLEKTVNLVWRAQEELPKPDASRVAALWRNQDHEFGRNVKPDYVCRDYLIGNNYPQMLGDYDRLPLNVMRAQVCKIILSYIDGGVYMDLDVRTADGVHISSWYDTAAESYFGWDREGLVADWFFAVRANSPLMKCMLDKFAANIKAPVIVKTPEEVSEVTGAKAFSKAAIECGVNATLSVADMNGGKLVHEVASEKWSRENPMGYRSFARELQNDLMPYELHYVWLGDKPPPMSEPLAAQRFAGMEPQYRQIWHRGEECDRFANAANVKALYDKLHGHVEAQARFCSVLAIESEGGLYFDTDVRYKEHLTSWLDMRPDAGVVFAQLPDAEGGAPRVAPWVFAAVPRHKCMAAIRAVMVERITAGKTGLDATGATAFGEGAKRCGLHPGTVTNQMASEKYIQHPNDVK